MAVGDITEKRLGGPQQPGVATTTLVTVPSAHRYLVKQIIICNTSSSTPYTITMAIGTAATAANMFMAALSISPNETLTLDTALVLEAAETIQSLASLANVLTVIINGWDHEI